jgi:hypothetical protein
VTVCDDTGVAAQAAACARQAASDQDVAVVGSISIVGNTALVPVLQQEGIAWFAPIVPAFPNDLTNPISFPVDNVTAQNASELALAFENGCQKVSSVMNASSANLITSIYSLAAKAYGTNLNAQVPVPVQATDLSPQVAQALAGGTDCIVTAISTSQFASFLPPWFQSGTTAVIYGGGGQLPTQGVPGYDPKANGSYNISLLPDITTDVFANYRAALKANNAPTNLNYDSITGVGAWTAYAAFADVAKTIQGDVTAASFLNAANHDAKVGTDGILPTIDFTKPWTSGPQGQLRSFNCGITVQKLENGHFVQVSDKWQNAAPLIAGTGKLGSPQPVTSTALQCQS